MNPGVTFFLWVGIFLSLACDRVVIIELPAHKSQIVANALLSDSEPLRLYVSQSVGIFDTASVEDRLLKEANVVLYEDNVPYPAVFIDTVLIDSAGNPTYPPTHYYSPLSPRQGHSYRLQIQQAGFEPIEAATTIPLSVPIENLQFVDNAFQDPEGLPQFRLSITFPDPPGLGNYYHLTAIVEQFDSTSGIPRYFESLVFENDANIGERAYDGGILLSDDVFDGQFAQGDYYGKLPPSIARVQVNGRYLWTSLFVELRHVSSEYYAYQVAFRANQESQGGQSGFFSRSPVSAFSNVEGGYGIFAGFTTFRDTLLP